MAFMNQEHKKRIAEKLNAALKGSGLKWSLRVQHHSTIIITVSEGPIDFVNNYENTDSGKKAIKKGWREPGSRIQVNGSHLAEQFTGEALDCLKTITECLNLNNWDRSDIQSDYFDVGHYINILIGTYDKPYKLITPNEKEKI
jgi:hypothetical protein